MTGFDPLLGELLEISRQIDTATGAERQRLEERREELRTQARKADLSRMDPAALQAEVQRLRRRLTELDAERVQIPRWQRYAGTFSDPEAAGRNINQKIDEANAPERASLEERIAHIEEALDDGR
jgi:chromosome segregation ATPase